MNIPPEHLSNHKPYSSTIHTFGWNNQQLLLASQKFSNAKSLAAPEEVPMASKSAFANDTDVEALGGIRLMASGGSHALVCFENGELYSFGRGNEGQLGLNSTEDSVLMQKVPLQLQEGEEIISLDCGDRHSVVVTSKHHCIAFGSSMNGQCGLGQKKMAIEPEVIELIISKPIVKVSCGSRHTIFVTKKGVMWATGQGKFGQLGTGENRDVSYPVPVLQDNDWRAIDVRAQGYQNIALSSDYSVYVWGGQPFKEGRDEGSPQAVNTPRRVCHNILGRRCIGIASASSHYFCLTSDGSVFVFGHKLSMSGYPKYLTNIMKVYNKYPDRSEQEEHLTETEIEWRNMLNLSSKHIVDSECPDLPMYKIQFLPTNDRIVDISCGDSAAYFITESGRVWAMGQARFHELGNSNTEALKPQQIRELGSEFVAKIVPGCWHAYALSGSWKNFRSTHLNLGQTIPKVLEKMEQRIKEEKNQ